MEEKLLPLIIDWQMNKIEAKAWKLSIMYIQLAQKYFPNYKHYQIGKGDPRKTSLFRHCYKLLRESNLKDQEYRMYITAQFQILKNINQEVLINPNCLVGTKAWNRWLVWKKEFNKTQITTKTELGIDINISKELINSKKFLLTKFKELSKKDIIISLNNRNLFKWIALGQISPCYLLLSPTVKEWIKTTKTNLLERFAIDTKLCIITQETEELFKKEFSYEF